MKLLLYVSSITGRQTFDGGTVMDDNKTVYFGSDESRLERNAPNLLNALYTTGFFADMRAPRLEDQIQHVLFSHQEFGTN